MFKPGDRVRVNWCRKGKYYDARIINGASGGYLVQYMDYEDEFEDKVRGEDIIGRQHGICILVCKPCLHARAGPQDYTLDCPNPDCQNKLTSNCWYLNVPDDEPNVLCCSSCGAKYMKWTGYKKFHKRGENKPYTWRQTNRK